MNVNRIVGFARRGSGKSNSKTTSHTNKIEWCSVAVAAKQDANRQISKANGACVYAYAEWRLYHEKNR